MLQITIPSTEYFNESINEFVVLKEQTLNLEHSLVSISKWESKWCKPFLSKEARSLDESIDYVRCMTLTQNVNPLIYTGLTSELLRKIDAYINAPMTATWFKDDKRRSRNRSIITSEILYYQMISLKIPFECQKWHLNRLLTLIRVCDEKNAPPKNMSNKEILKRNHELNEARKKKFHTKG